jgi:hypothetical protein
VEAASVLSVTCWFTIFSMDLAIECPDMRRIRMVWYSFAMGWPKPITENNSNDHDNKTYNSASDSFSESSFLPTTHGNGGGHVPNVTAMES